MYIAKLKSIKLGAFNAPFGIALMVIGAYLLISENEFPFFLRKIAYRYPETQESMGMLIYIFAVFGLIFGALILDIGFRSLISQRYRNMFLGVTESKLYFPSLLAGVQHSIPLKDVIGIGIENGAITVRYNTREGESLFALHSAFVNGHEDFIRHAETFWHKIKERNSGEGLQEFSVNVYPDAKGEIQATQVHALSKILKRSESSLLQECAESGCINIKRELNAEAADKLVLGLQKYGIGASKSSTLNDKTENGYEIEIKPAPMLIPTFTAMLSLGFIPGGLVIWLFITKILFERSGHKLSIGPASYIAAIAMELMYDLDFSDEVFTAFFMMASTIAATIFIGFDVKRAIRDIPSLRTENFNLALLLIFPIIYLNIKMNKLIRKQASPE